ncbi:MAG TPA: hypothetical protein VFL14_14550 [Xanthomonadales bacterium]|nr:hypothetical protein [Xanthomonadales bacterium]
MGDARDHENDPIAVRDADLIARLAAGEHLGERHDAELARIAASPALASVLRLALATQGPAEALAAGIEQHRAPRVVPFAARPRRRVLPWVAMAATVAGVALLATSVQRDEAPAGGTTVAAQPQASDQIFGGGLEGAIADAGEQPADDDDIFDGEFDS